MANFYQAMPLQEEYTTRIVPELMDKLGYNNPYAVPRVEKVVLNMGLGNAKDKEEELEEAIEELSLIAGQRAVATRARKSVAGFALREGQKIGARVTLRGERMYEFLEKLFKVVLPRTRDFRGLSRKSFDGHGNYSIGLEEQVIFPEIDPNKVRRSRGLQVTIVTSTDSDTEAEKLLTRLGLPLKEVRGEKGGLK